MKRLCFLVAAILVSVLAACGSSNNVKAREDALRVELSKAQALNAKDCAPEEFARAQASLEFAQIEKRQGDYIRAEDHLEEGFRMAKAAQRGAKNCKQVVIAKASPTPPPVVVVRTATPSPSPSSTPLVVVVATATPTDTPVVIVKVEPSPTPQVIIVEKTPTPAPSPTVDVSKIDSDGDGVPDIIDDCPADPGPAWNHGCPTPTPTATPAATPVPIPTTEFKTIIVDLTKKRIELKHQIHFETGKAIIARDSFNILDEITQLMKDNAGMEIRIEGHTDSMGAATMNLELSKARADSCRSYLIRAGVPTSRISAVGLGATQPIDTNRTAEGRAANRRTEFHITRD